MVNLTVIQVPADAEVNCASQPGAELANGDGHLFPGALAAASELRTTKEEPGTTRSSAPVDSGAEALVTVALTGHAGQVVPVQPTLPGTPGSSENAQANGQSAAAETGVVVLKLAAAGPGGSPDAVVVLNDARSVSAAEAELGADLQRPSTVRLPSRDVAAETQLVQGGALRTGTPVSVEGASLVQHPDEATHAGVTDAAGSAGPSQGRGSDRAGGKLRPSVAVEDRTSEPAGSRWRQATVAQSDGQQQAARSGPLLAPGQNNSDAGSPVSQAGGSVGERSSEAAVPRLNVDGRLTRDSLLRGSAVTEVDKPTGDHAEKASAPQSGPARDRVALERARSEANVAAAVTRAAPEPLRVDRQMESLFRAAVFQRSEPGAAEIAVSGSALEAGSGDSSASGNSPASAAFASTSGPQFSAAMGEATQAAELPATGELDQHTRIIDQLVREVRLHRFDDRSDLLVRLSPPELGALRVRITQNASGVSSHIQASSDQVKGLLQAHLPTLVDALSDTGLKMGSVSVSSGSSFSALAHDAAHGNAQSGADQAGQSSTLAQDSAAVQTAGAASELPGHVDQAGYNWLA